MSETDYTYKDVPRTSLQNGHEQTDVVVTYSKVDSLEKNFEKLTDHNFTDV